MLPVLPDVPILFCVKRPVPLMITNDVSEAPVILPAEPITIDWDPNAI